MTVLEEASDKELIKRYTALKDERAAEVLVRRHYDRMYMRFRKSVKDGPDAHDLCQKLWLKVLKNIAAYKETGKFVHYLNTAASNLLKDHWRSGYTGQTEEMDEARSPSPRPQPETEIAARQQANVVVTQLIPQLSVKLRLPFLLKHESEYWEEKHPLMWHHLAELNGLNVASTARMFREARDKLLQNTHSPEAFTELSDEEQLLFLVWTQAQREEKHQKMTEDYLAGLVGIPVNTFKTRYRAAVKELKKGLEKWG